ncbi:phage holin family protein [Rhodohalobacter sp. 8-1]|uniref:phage holin family protein n=1 Tax=Rhodohalobacter sp. 8-1 TaxID=3131972 RepID=UPI0030EBF944
MIKTLLINSIVIFAGSYLLNGVTLKNYWTALGVAIVLAILNLFIRPFIVLLTLPLTILTLGLFTLVINAWILMLADKLVDGFTIKGFWWAVLFSLFISILNSLLFVIF